MTREEIVTKLNKYIFRIASRYMYVRFVGEYSSWIEAEKDCIGYDSERIFDKAKLAIDKVLNGEAEFERDTFLFYKKEINYPLMSYLALIYNKMGTLDVIDWGGGFGSTYFQNIHFLKMITNELSWNVIEQKHFVDYAKKKIKKENLHFEYALEDVKNLKLASCILLSGVLHYISFADELLSKIIDMQIPYVIIERQPVAMRDIYTKEIVREPIYNANYAMHIFDEKLLIEKFTDRGYVLVDSWKSLVDRDVWIGENMIQFKSFVLKLNSI